MSLIDWASFLPLILAIVFCILLYRRAWPRAPMPTQFWLQDFLIGVLTFAVYLLFLDREGDFRFGSLRAIVLAALALITAAELFRDTRIFGAPLRRATVVVVISSLFLWFGELAVLSWWLLRSMASFYNQNARRSEDCAPLSLNIGFLLFAVSFAASFLLPVHSRDVTPMRGWQAYVLMFADTDPSPSLPWAANPILWVSAIAFMERRYGISIAYAFLALTCGLFFYIDPDPEMLTLNPGYHLWLTSMLVLSLTAAWAFVRNCNSVYNVKNPPLRTDVIQAEL